MSSEAAIQPPRSKRPWRPAERLLVLGLVSWVVFALGGITLYAMRRASEPLEPPLPQLYPVRPFTFTDQNGEPFQSAKALERRVWIANVIFTRCPSICPMFTRKMAEVQKKVRNLGDALHLVSFTVDPDYDTPPVLKEYAEKHGASPRLWTFLTGDRQSLKRTIVDDMKVHMSDEVTDDLMALAHGGHFVLVDAQMKVRGVYNSEDEDAVERLVHDAARLINEK